MRVQTQNNQNQASAICECHISATKHRFVFLIERSEGTSRYTCQEGVAIVVRWPEPGPEPAPPSEWEGDVFSWCCAACIVDTGAGCSNVGIKQPSLIKKRSVPTFVHLEKRSHFTILPLRLWDTYVFVCPLFCTGPCARHVTLKFPSARIKTWRTFLVFSDKNLIL